MPDLHFALMNAVRFIAGRQATNGHFPSQVSLQTAMSSEHEENSVYIHSYVLQSLSHVDYSIPQITEIIRKAHAYLVSAQRLGWWRFYGPEHKEPPDDADDTAVAYAALLSSMDAAPDGSLAAQADAWLAGLERIRSESGLYKTWADEEWNAESFDLPDVMVNANIFFLQSVAGRPDARVSNYLARTVRTRTYQLLNLFAASDFTVPFLISRCNHRGATPKLRESMDVLRRDIQERQNPDGDWGNTLDSVLALLTLVNAGGSGRDSATTAAIELLLQRQLPDGGWESGPFFRDLHPRYYGSRTLTTALCAEAISRLRASLNW